MVQSQPRQIVCETLSQKNPSHWGGEGGGGVGGKGGEMNQALYAHMNNKRKKTHHTHKKLADMIQ
jgi:hypothetical protein